MFNIKLKNGDKFPYTVAKAQEIITDCKGKVYYRYGYAYRGARESEITKEEALVKAKDTWTDLSVDNDGNVHINQYSCNDMY